MSGNKFLVGLLLNRLLPFVIVDLKVPIGYKVLAENFGDFL